MEEEIYSIISEHFGISRTEITPAMELKHDLNATDLEIADFLQILEKTFNVTITKDDAIKLFTVSDIVSFITDHAEEIA